MVGTMMVVVPRNFMLLPLNPTVGLRPFSLASQPHLLVALDGWALGRRIKVSTRVGFSGLAGEEQRSLASTLVLSHMFPARMVMTSVRLWEGKAALREYPSQQT